MDPEDLSKIISILGIVTGIFGFIFVFWERVRRLYLEREFNNLLAEIDKISTLDQKEMNKYLSQLVKDIDLIK